MQLLIFVHLLLHSEWDWIAESLHIIIKLLAYYFKYAVFRISLLHSNQFYLNFPGALGIALALKGTLGDKCSQLLSMVKSSAWSEAEPSNWGLCFTMICVCEWAYRYN